MDLILARCGPDAALFGDISSLDESDRERLLDRGTARASALAMPISANRMAIGRRSGGRCTWWLTPASMLLEPPHALWLEPELFEVEGGGSMPHTLDVLALWDSLPAGTDWSHLLGTLVQSVRAQTPVSIALQGVPAESIAILLAWLLGRHPERGSGERRAVSIAVGHPERVAEVSFGGPGVSIELSELPKLVDPVARFVRRHFSADPMRFETRAGVDAGWVQANSAAERGANLSGQLGTSGSLGEFGEALVMHTLSTSDPAPWLALRRRPAVVREAAVARLLDAAPRFQPHPDLIEALDEVYPRGAPLAPWCAALLEWMRRSQAPRVVLSTLENALLDWPAAGAAVIRASMWTEAIRVLVGRGEHVLAREALSSQVALMLINEGSGISVATMWAAVPAEHREPSDLAALLARLSRIEGGDGGAAQLFHHVLPDQTEVRNLIELWFAHAGPRAALMGDRLRAAVWDSEHRRSWLIRAVASFGEDVVGELLEDVPPSSGLWVEYEAATGVGRTALARLRRMGQFAAGRVALVPVACGLLADALAEVQFPDVRLAKVALSFLDVPGSPALWAWVAVAAAPPGAYPDAMIDGTVVDLCQQPPRGSTRALALQVTERLAFGSLWSPLDHARWMVRFALAPDGDHTGFHDQMANRLVHAVGQRPDGALHLAGMVKQLLQLDASHPALQALFLRWLPGVWPRPPQEFISLVEPLVPPSLSAPWAALAHR